MTELTLAGAGVLKRSDGLHLFSKMVEAEVEREQLVNGALPVRQVLLGLPYVNDKVANNHLERRAILPDTRFVDIGRNDRASLVRLARSLEHLYRNQHLSEASALPRVVARGLSPLMFGLDYEVPSFTPKRTITCTTAKQFNVALSKLSAGDYLDCRGIAFTGEVAIANHVLEDWAEIHFGDDPNRVCTFSGGSGSLRPSVWLNGNRNLRLYGGDISNSNLATGGSGVAIYGNENLLWWDFVIHDCCGDGLSVLPNNLDISNVDLKGEIYRIGLRPVDDPGNGWHGVNYSDGSYGIIDRNRLALHVHDHKAGSAIRMGSSNQQTSLHAGYLKAHDLTGVGNGIEIWGNDNSGIVEWKHVEAYNLQGRVVNGQGLMLQWPNFKIGSAIEWNTNLRGENDDLGRR